MFRISGVVPGACLNTMLLRNSK